MSRHRVGDPSATEYVSTVSAHVVEVVSMDPARAPLFARLGARRTGIMGGHWRIGVGDDDELRTVLVELHDAGLRFAPGPAERLAALHG